MVDRNATGMKVLEPQRIAAIFVTDVITSVQPLVRPSSHSRFGAHESDLRSVRFMDGEVTGTNLSYDSTLFESNQIAVSNFELIHLMALRLGN